MSERKVSESVLFCCKYRPSLLSVSAWCLFFMNCYLHMFTYSWSFYFNCACLIYYKSWLIWMLLCSILRFLFNTVSGKAISFLSFILPKPDSHGKSLPRGGNLTFSRSLGVGNLTLASMKMSNSPLDIPYYIRADWMAIIWREWPWSWEGKRRGHLSNGNHQDRDCSRPGSTQSTRSWRW